MASWNPYRNDDPRYHRPLTPADMEPLEDDIDPESLKVITNILESSSGRRWLERFIIECVGSSHIIIRTEQNGMCNGYIRSYDIPDWAQLHPIRAITIKPKDSWLKKWIKRQLM